MQSNNQISQKVSPDFITKEALSSLHLHITLPIAKMIGKCQKCTGMGLNGFIFKKIIKNYAENMKKIVGAV